MPPRRDGSLPAAARAAVDAGLVNPPARPALGTTSAQGHPVWVVPVILVDFTDQPLSSLSTPTAWEKALFDTTHTTPNGSVYDYYQWVSRGQFRIVGKVVAVAHLSGNKNYYAWSSYGLGSGSTPHNDYGVVNEAISLCDNQVDFSAFDQDHDGYVDMLWVVHSGLGGEATVSTDNLYSVTSQMDQWSNGSTYITNDPVPNGGGLKIRINRFSILPELSAFRSGQLSEIGVFCHEFGHALGLPDLYDTSGSRNYGPGYFSLMSSGVYGTDGQSPELPSHMGAWAAQYLGWVQTVTPAFDTTMTLAAIEDGGPILDYWFQGKDNPEHFLIEHRHRTGFDVHLPSEGMVLYHVDDARIQALLGANRINTGSPPALRVVEADGIPDLIAGTSRGDAADMFPGSSGRTHVDDDTSPDLLANSGAPTGLVLEGIHETGGQLGFTAHVRARGWKPAAPLPGLPGSPSLSTGPGPRAALLLDDSVMLVSSEATGGGLPQIRVRTQLGDGTWRPAEVITHSSGSAVDPAIAPAPAGGAAVVWSDSREGVNQLWYRSKLNGVWSAETRLTSLPGSSRTPSVGVDGHGFVHVTWLYTLAGAPQVRYQRFYFLNPTDTSVAITGASDRPDAPEVMVRPTGEAIVMWPERSVSPTRLWFCHVDPDSGVGARNRLTAFDGTLQPVFSSRVDPDGTMHTIWMVPSSQNEIHYQRRESWGLPPSVRDTVLERRGESIQNLSLALDPGGRPHISFEISNAGVPQVLYKRLSAAHGWDMASTEVTLPSDGIATRPWVVPRDPSLVSVLYLSYPGGTPTWMERRRDLRILTVPTSVPDAPLAPRHWLGLSPDPARTGDPVRVVWAGPPLTGEPRVTLYDLAGRRVAEARMIRSGTAWVATLPAAATREWGAGVYFARIDGERDSARLVLLR